ncbi:esterase [Mycobacterium deserti]|uniref:RsiV family protein n=1 Tax=Mycobacterium deserti TaxID=2978347 RepID=A0ABT2M400_9MYCO|nr:esterase [Mycobacterium deserti]MCT7656988.1 RsiV family protein [Mycobacterium deserti]
MVRRLVAVLTAGIVMNLATHGIAAAQSACADLSAAVAADQTCHTHSAGLGYTVDVSFPTDYPDRQALTDYVMPLRDDFVDFVSTSPAHQRPYSLVVEPTTYHSGGASGTHSVVLELIQDSNPRPMAWYKTFNYDSAARTPITLRTLFVPGADPMAVAFPAVRRQLEKRWRPDVLDDMLGVVEESTFQEFALTDHAVIFFFGQGWLLGHPEGPLEVVVPREDFGSLLAH